ncbi:MAG: DUF2203 domain-containing protein [Nanoarchaeota archaeon]
MFFTIESAEKTLPRLKGLLRKAIHLNRQLQALHAESLINQEEIQVETEDQNIHYQFEVVKNHEQLHELTEDFYGVMEQIETMGVEVKDLEQGLIDFPGQFEGREIYLCWKLGEDRIRHWHELDTGFDARQEIIELD